MKYDPEQIEQLNTNLQTALHQMEKVVENLKQVVELLDMHDCFMSDGKSEEAKDILQKMLKGIE